MLSSSSTRGVMAAVVVGVAALLAGAQDKTPAVAVVVKVKGGVFQQAPGAAAWAAAQAGNSLASGTQMKTEADGLAMVKFISDGSMMKLKPQTHLTFAARESKGVLLSLGAARFDVKPSDGKDKFTVTTPTGVATVKGTQFWVSSAGDTASSIVVLDGTVNVKCSKTNKAKNVKRGYTALLGPNGLEVRETRGSDLPEQSQKLEFEFKDPQGKTRTLQIDAVQEQ